MSKVTTEIKVERATSNKLNETKLKNQVHDITNACKNRASVSNISAECIDLKGPEEEDGSYFYSFTVILSKPIARSEAVAVKMLEKAKIFVIRAAEAREWKAVDKKEKEEKVAISEDRPSFQVNPIDDEIINNYFNGIYERDAHIRLIHSSTESFVESGHEDRNHVLLYGPPASCKTKMFESFKRWYEHGGDVERVALVNSTTISKAGLETWILEKAQSGVLPDILCFDEIEKFNMDNLFCLFSIMDEQGLITRTNARIGKQSASAKVLVWATCNNETKLQEFKDGALYSRFSKTLPCTRPTRELMLEILLTKLEKRRKMGKKADDRWAKIAVDYCFDTLKENDPRKIISLLDGKDRLLDGSYIKDLEDINKAYNISLTYKSNTMSV